MTIGDELVELLNDLLIEEGIMNPDGSFNEAPQADAQEQQPWQS